MVVDYRVAKNIYLDRALDLHSQALVVDAHADTLDRCLNAGIGIDTAQPGLHLDLPRLVQVGCNLQFLSLWVPPEYQGTRALHRALKLASLFHETRRRCPQMRLIGQVQDVSPDRPGFCLSLEGADPLASDPQVLSAFYALGVRMIALTWNGRNDFADGLKVGERPGGVTALGAELLRAMASLGIVLDLAHIAEAGFWHALELTAGPVVVSHANAKAVWDHPRNLNDQQLRAIAERNGVVGACFAPAFLGEEPTPATIADHIIYLASVMGIDHVGLGGDLDGIPELPQGMAGLQDLPLVTAALLQRGLTEGDLFKILGGNWVRVLAEVWRA